MQDTMKQLIRKKNFTAKSDNLTSSDVINILMVDDLQENLVTLEAVLSSPDYHLVTARSGEEALKCILKQDFAVILMDVQMPGLNGFETAKLIKERKKSKNIPIIFITAISQDMEHVLKGYSVGAIDYIFKPFNPETLKSKIEQFVNMHQEHKEILMQTEWKKTIELEEVNQKLNLATVDLLKNETLSKVIGETLLDTIVTFDKEGYILSVNPIVKKMFGYQQSEVMGKHLSILLPAIKGKDEIITNLSMKSYDNLTEAIAKRKDKSQFPADIQVGEAKVDDFIINVCTIRDVTVRKEMEKVKNQQFNVLKKVVEERTLDLLSANQKLKKEMEEKNKIMDDLYVSHERFRKIFNSSPCLMAIRCIIDGRFIDVNRTWVNFTGYDEKEINDPQFEWTLNKMVDETEISFPSHEWDTPLCNVKVRYKTKKGELRHGLLSTEIIDIQNKECVLVVVNDITERERLEKEMLRLDRLNLIGEMAAGIAHEIRNPMTTVHGFLQMGKLNNEQLSVEYIDLMLEELNRANNIIKEFLTLAKNKKSDKTKQSLNKIIETLLPLINAEAILAGKRVNHHLEDCPEISIDEKEIRQLFLNLALNGLEAMGSGGILMVRTFSENGDVVLEVEDTGSGIKPEILEKIGTPFFTTKDKGTGLGLAVCYSIADRHNASIKIQSSSEGTVFHIHFKPEITENHVMNGEKQ